MPILPTLWLRKKMFLGGTALIIVLAAFVTMKMSSWSRPLMAGDTPLPFGMQGASLQGQLTRFGQRNGIDVFDVTFNHTESSEHLVQDKIYLVHVPNSSSGSDVPLDLALTLSGTGGHLVDYYGYRYSDTVATLEKRDIKALRFKDRFPGQFFMSQTARKNDAKQGNLLSTFETVNQIAFLRTDNFAGGVRLDPAGALYVIVVNEVGGADLAVRDVIGCGNAKIELAEQCDDGNQNNADNCRNDCSIGLPIPLDQVNRFSGATLVIKQVAGTGAVSNPSPIIPLVRFTAFAKDPTLITHLSFKAQTGSLTSLRNYRMWQDTNADGVTDRPVSPSVEPKNDLVTFENPLNWTGAIVLSASGTIFELKAEVYVGPRFSLRVGFALDDANVVGAKRTGGTFDLLGITKNGECPVVKCQISLQTSSATLWTLGDDLFGVNLFVTSKALQETDTVVRNKKDVVLQRFEAHGQSNIILTRAVFDAQQGSLPNAQNYALWVDTDDNGIVDTILQNNVSIDSGLTNQGDTVIFQNLLGDGFFIPNEKAVIFEVHADISASAAPGIAKLQLKFATSNPDYLSAKRASDGKSLFRIRTNGVCEGSCGITVLTIPSTVYTIRSQGDLFVTKDSTPVRSRQLLGGTLGDSILKLQFHAEYEPVSPISLRFTAVGDGVSSVDSLELYQVGETEPIAFATKGACGDYPAQFCTGSQKEFTVQKGSDHDLIIRPRMKSDVDGAVSGDDITLSLEAPDSVIAVGELSSNSLLINAADASEEGRIYIGSDIPTAHHSITGNKNVVVLSKIASITNNDPNTNGTAVPSGLLQTIGQFKFGTLAASNLKNGVNKWTLTDIMFDVEAINVEFDKTSFRFANKQDLTTVSTCDVIDDDGSSFLHVGCFGIDQSPINTAINPASDETFVLVAEILNAQVDRTKSSSLQVSLTNFTNALVDGLATGLNHIRWSDRDATPETGGFFWIEYPETIVRGTVYGDNANNVPLLQFSNP